MAVTLSPKTVSSELLLDAVDSIDFKPPTVFKARGKFDGNSRITLFPLTSIQVAVAEHWKYFYLEVSTHKFVAVVSYFSSKADSVICDVESSCGESGVVFDAFIHSIPYLPKLGQSLRTAFQSKALDFPRANDRDFNALHCFLEKWNIDVVCSELVNVADRIVQSVGDSFLRYSLAGGDALNALVIGEKKDLLFMAAKFTTAGYNSLVLNLYGEMGGLPTVSKAVMSDSPYIEAIEEDLQAEELRPLESIFNLNDACYFTEHCSLYADVLLDQCPTLTPRVMFATPSAASLYVPKLTSPINQVIVLNGHSISDLELLAILSTQVECHRLSIYIEAKEDAREFPLFENKYIQPRAVSLWFAQ
uniref:PPM-type phosphatase domain-containing protein n=1 Tax=Panagrellus redivivus TaxID=6233 RepID=A0A7E4VCY4_PANRE